MYFIFFIKIGFKILRLTIKKLIIIFLRFVGICYQSIEGFLIYIKSRKPNISIYKPIQACEKICIYAAYRNNFDKSVEMTLDDLKTNGFKIIFVSNVKLNNEFINKLKSKVDICIERSNYGRCIAAYKTGFLFLREQGFYSARNLLFMNDTSIFPLFETDEFWKEINECKADIAGIYGSYEHSYHIQSYFLYCKNKVFYDSNFISFWEKYLPVNSKILIIKYGEIGFSKMCVKARYELYTFVNQLKINKFLSNNVNFDPNCIPLNLLDNRELLFNFLTNLSHSNFNPSHALGLIAPKYIGLPMLKTDLVSAGTFTKKQINLMLKNIISNPDLCDIENELCRKLPKTPMNFIYKLKKYSQMI